MSDFNPAPTTEQCQQIARAAMKMCLRSRATGFSADLPNDVRIAIWCDGVEIYQRPRDLTMSEHPSMLAPAKRTLARFTHEEVMVYADPTTDSRHRLDAVYEFLLTTGATFVQANMVGDVKLRAHRACGTLYREQPLKWWQISPREELIAEKSFFYPIG